MGRPAVVLFDVNGTLSDMSAMAGCFAEVGAPGTLAQLWFAQVLRDGFALAAAGSAAPFREIGGALLRPMLAGADLNWPVDEAVDVVLDGMAGLPLHSDVTTGVRALAADGYRLVALTNGAATVPERLFTSAGIRDAFEAVLSVDDAGVWKPAAGAYAYAAAACGVPPGDMVLTAAHPWDVTGAARAGLRTAWINRDGAAYPAYCTPLDWTVTGVNGLSAALAR